MINIIRKMICLHDYGEIRETKYYSYIDKSLSKTVILYACKKCGRFKKIKM